MERYLRMAGICTSETKYLLVMMSSLKISFDSFGFFFDKTGGECPLLSFLLLLNWKRSYKEEEKIKTGSQVSLHFQTWGSSLLNIHEFLSDQMLQHIVMMIYIEKGNLSNLLMCHVARSGLSHVGTIIPIEFQQFLTNEHLKKKKVALGFLYPQQAQLTVIGVQNYVLLSKHTSDVKPVL
jgi:hypothetical protein